MQALAPLALLAGVYLAVLASPGPNFVILTQLALEGRRREARWVVLGLTTGSVVWVTLAMAGLSALLARHPWLASAVRLLGAAYLVWYGLRLLRSAFFSSAVRGTAEPTPDGSRWTAYRASLVTGVTNPKGAAFWTSAFATLFPIDAPAWFHVATVAMVIAMSLAWHLGITLVFDRPVLRAAYLRVERRVDAVTGGLLVAFGVQRILAR